MGRDEPKNGTVYLHQNLAKQDHLNKWNNLSTKVFFIQLLDLYKEMLLVRMGNARNINVVIFILQGTFTFLIVFFFNKKALKRSLTKFFRNASVFFLLYA